MSFRFESLEIWHKAREFSSRIYEVTAKFPAHELYGLASQMNRASNAVSLLIAEGSELDTTAEKQKEIYQHGETLGRQINAFRKTLR